MTGSADEYPAENQDELRAARVAHALQLIEEGLEPARENNRTLELEAGKNPASSDPDTTPAPAKQ